MKYVLRGERRIQAVVFEDNHQPQFEKDKATSQWEMPHFPKPRPTRPESASCRLGMELLKIPLHRFPIKEVPVGVDD